MLQFVEPLPRQETPVSRLKSTPGVMVKFKLLIYNFLYDEWEHSAIAGIVL